LIAIFLLSIFEVSSLLSWDQTRAQC
jgi:hypothetical protein